MLPDGRIHLAGRLLLSPRCLLLPRGSLEQSTALTPIATDEAAYQTWAGVLGENAADLIDRIQNGEPTVLDPYAATNPAEYFAVATETFFEKPHQLKAMRPELYAELQNFYQLDPSEWLEV